MNPGLLEREMLYHGSLSPFSAMLKSGVISEEDYRVIETILREKYDPVFVGDKPPKQLDNTKT